MTYKASIILDGIVEAESEEQAKEIFAEEMGDEFLCWFVPEDVEVEPQVESEDKKMTEFVVLSRVDIHILCDDKPVTIWIDGKPYVLCTDEYFEKQNLGIATDEEINYAIEKIKESGLAEDIFQWLGENLGSPCDYSFHDVTPGEYLMEEVPGYCDRFCVNCKDAECWKMYLTTVLNARKAPTNFEVIKNMDDEELSVLMEDLTHYDDVGYEWRSKLSPLLPFEDWKDWLNRRAICSTS